MNKFFLASLTLVLLGLTQVGFAQESSDSEAADLAIKLSNPIASLISVPLQNNTDVGIGTQNGSRNTLNIQPVIPIALSDQFNLIVRWVQPVISQYNITGPNTQEFGLGDAVASAFISPSKTTGGITWGVGPVFLVPDGTNDFLSSRKFGIGPTAIALIQSKGYTFGALVNQIWSIAGDETRNDINQLFLQPFFAYNWKSGAGLGGNFELTQNWESSSTTVWFNPTLSAVTSIGNQKAQFVVGPRFNLAAPEGSRADFGIRAVAILLFPN